MSAVEVASLFATLSLNDQMTRGLQQADRSATSFASRLQQTGSRLSGFGAGMAQALAPVTGFLTSGVDVAARFELSMAEISARTGLVGDDLETVRDLAMQMGADTAFSAQQAADAFLQLLSSGQSLEQATATLPSVLDAAAASGMDLGAAADATTDILAMFGLQVENLPPDVKSAADALGITDERLEEIATSGDSSARELEALATATGRTTGELMAMIKQEDAATVVDSLARAAGASSATMDDLVAGLQNVGPVAAQFGMDVDETAAALAVLAENGIKGSEAGTALKSMLLQMSQNTPAATAAWDELGVSLYDAQGDVRDMDTVLDELKLALGDLPVEDQNRLMQDLAGSYGIMALSALIGSVGISEMQTAMDGAADAASTADARMAGWQGANDALQGSLETLQIQVLTPLLNDVLTPLVQKITEIVNQFTAWAEDNPELANTLVTILGGLVLLIGVLAPLGVLISTVGTVVGAATAAFGLLTGAISGPILPILAVAAAIAAVIAQLNEFNRIVGAARENAQAVVGPMLESGEVSRQQLDDAAFAAVAQNFGGGVFGDLAARLTYSNFADAVAQRAAGGPVTAGTPYLVGERGPELFVPGSGGAIVPSGGFGGGVVIHLTAYGSHPYDLVDMLERAARDIR